jgi:hypothetical protein
MQKYRYIIGFLLPLGLFAQQKNRFGESGESARSTSKRTTI